jgi:3-deoxy-D-manno-octulosonic-acid transferase
MNLSVQLIYNLLLTAFVLAGLPFLIPWVAADAKRRATVFNRLKTSPAIARIHALNRRGSRIIWIHALSVGEVLSSAALVKSLALSCKDHRLVFSVSTLTGFDIAQRKLAADVEALFFFPYDFWLSVKWMIHQVRPAVVVIVETDVWPNFLFELKKRQIPVFLANARLSDRSYQGYKRIAFFSRSIFAVFNKICAQSVLDAERFQAMGVPRSRIMVCGNIKFDNLCDLTSPQTQAAISAKLDPTSGRKTVVAGSTHPGEEELLLKAFCRWRQIAEHLLLIIAPRNPRRAAKVGRLCEQAGYRCTFLGTGAKRPACSETDVLVVDQIGILRTLYQFAVIAFVGGSLVDCGGHNPLEPAACSKPVLFGPDMGDFKSISRLLLAAQGAFQVDDGDSLAAIGADLLLHPKKAELAGRRAFAVASASKGGVDKLVGAIKQCL